MAELTKEQGKLLEVVGHAGNVVIASIFLDDQETTKRCLEKLKVAVIDALIELEETPALLSKQAS